MGAGRRISAPIGIGPQRTHREAHACSPGRFGMAADEGTRKGVERAPAVARADHDVTAAEFDHLEAAEPKTGLDRAVDRLGNWVCYLFLIGAAISFYEV